ncbi:MAG TPA: extracellular solute-binding protein [Pirellulales bacterium]|jgi:iron(III) transport system substrate-binding protein|nr:extracellular solute-binding protein [Pirellulales bacterium]
MRTNATHALHIAFCLLGAALPGCWSDSAAREQVVVYVALDQPFSEPILDDYARETGTEVRPKFDAESTKTLGLTTQIVQESKRPRCDVFWNNEILNTLRLEEQGLLDVYRSPAAAGYPEIFRSPNGTWHGFAARARILLVNTRLVGRDEMPGSVGDLADPKWRGRAGIAKPLFGTMATHAACLFALWGEGAARDFFEAIKENDVQVMSGNKQVAVAVGGGQLAFGLTDTDDAMVEIEQGSPVEIVYPDQGDDGVGTLFIPNTLAIVKGCPHPAAARKLVDYLLSPAVEERLARGPSAQIPLNPAVTEVPRVQTPATVKAMPVDFAAAVSAWDGTAAFLKETFATAE